MWEFQLKSGKNEILFLFQFYSKTTYERTNWMDGINANEARRSFRHFVLLYKKTMMLIIIHN